MEASGILAEMRRQNERLGIGCEDCEYRGWIWEHDPAGDGHGGLNGGGWEWFRCKCNPHGLNHPH